MYINKNLHNINFDFLLIDNQQKLQNFVDIIEEGDALALDTEFTRRDTYFAILSTIQIALKKNNKKSNKKIIVLVDALSGIDLKPLFSIISNPKITKIIHSSIQDLQIFFHISREFPKNIFDTQIMANFSKDFSNIGYANLVKELFEVDICKKMQISDWQKRPLKPSQIDYALIDVIFLHEIYEYFYEILSKQNRLNWLCEEMEGFVNNSLSDNSKNLIKTFTHRFKGQKQIASLNQLIMIREKYAKIYNLPREHLLKNHELNKMVEKGVDYDFDNLKCYTNFVLELRASLKVEHKNVEIIENNSLPKTQEGQNQINKIKSLVAKNSKKYKINEQFLLNSNKIKNIVLANKIDNTLNQWRSTILAKEINKILNS